MTAISGTQETSGGTAEHSSPTPDRSIGPLDGPVTQRGVIASESLKFRSLRSTLSVLGAAMLGMVVIGAIIAFNTRNPVGKDPEDIVASGPLQGYYLGQLLLGALGVLVVSSDYGTGMTRATLAAVPKRLPVLVAKTSVFTVMVGTAMTAASIAALYVAQAVLSGHRATLSLADGTTLRVVIGTGIYLTLVGLIGSALGWIIRSTPGALVATFAVILVLPILFELVFPSWGSYIAANLPAGVGASFATVLPQPHALTPWLGLGVMVAWVILGLVVSAVVLQRNDA